MPLAAIDLPVSVKTPWPAGFGRLDRLAVDHAGSGAGFPAGGFTHVHQQDMVNLLLHPAIAPIIEYHIPR
jgi:hypothetical protein